jgi:aminomethyltransferase
MADEPLRLRIGLKIEGRVPAREGARINDLAGELVGEVTSGGFGPTVGGPVAMGYVVREFAEPGTALAIVVRGKAVPATVVPLPFVPHRYKRR